MQSFCHGKSVRSVLLLALGLGFSSSGVLAKEVVVKIGHIAPLSGPQAHYGKDNESGARMAIDDLNASGHMFLDKPVKMSRLKKLVRELAGG